MFMNIFLQYMAKEQQRQEQNKKVEQIAQMY